MSSPQSIRALARELGAAERQLRDHGMKARIPHAGELLTQAWELWVNDLCSEYEWLCLRACLVDGLAGLRGRQPSLVAATLRFRWVMAYESPHKAPRYIMRLRALALTNEAIVRLLLEMPRSINQTTRDAAIRAEHYYAQLDDPKLDRWRAAALLVQAHKVKPVEMLSWRPSVVDTDALERALELLDAQRQPALHAYATWLHDNHARRPVPYWRWRATIWRGRFFTLDDLYHFNE